MVYTDMHIGIISILPNKIYITASCPMRYKTKNVLYRLVCCGISNIRFTYWFVE